MTKCKYKHCFNFRAYLTLQETQSIHDSINIPKIDFILYSNALANATPRLIG